MKTLGRSALASFALLVGCSSAPPYDPGTNLSPDEYFSRVVASASNWPYHPNTSVGDVKQVTGTIKPYRGIGYFTDAMNGYCVNSGGRPVTSPEKRSGYVVNGCSLPTGRHYFYSLGQSFVQNPDLNFYYMELIPGANARLWSQATESRKLNF